MELLTALNREQGITVLMVTHEADMAAYAQTHRAFPWTAWSTRDDPQQGGGP